MVAKQSYIPDAGELVWVDFNPTRGHEQRGRRPAYIVTTAAYNKRTQMALVCPITSQSKGYAFEVPVSSSKIQGYILTDQIRSIDWTARPIELIHTSTPAILAAVREKLQILIGG